MSAHAIGFEELDDGEGDVLLRAVCSCGWSSEPRRVRLTPYCAAVAHLRGWLPWRGGHDEPR